MTENPDGLSRVLALNPLVHVATRRATQSR